MEPETTKLSTRIFIGASIPSQVAQYLKNNLEGYTKFTKKMIPEENWHITFLFIGPVEDEQKLTKTVDKTMSQAFLPTISLTHIGRGLQKQQLWAYAKPTSLLTNIRKELTASVNTLTNISSRHNDFVPHIKLANLRPSPYDKLLADKPLSAVWQIKELCVYRSELSAVGANYTIIEKIKLT